MKLIELCTSPGVGGLELYAKKVIRYYLSINVECVVFVRSNSMLADWLCKENIPFQTLRSLSQYFPLLSAWKMARFCEKNAITTIHMHWRGDLPLAAFTKLFCRKKLNLVYTRQMALTKPKYDVYHKFVYGSIDYFLTITKKLKKQAIDYLPIKEENIQLLYYGVPKPEIANNDTCSYLYINAGLKTDFFTIGMFGRIEHEKGQHLLIEAVQRLINKGRNVQAAIIGHVMYEDYLNELEQDIADNKLDSNIKFLDFHPDPPSIMGCFDVIVLATYAETFGLVLAEAMRAGTTVIGTNAGGVPEIISDSKTGLLFEPGNAEQLSECLDKLYLEPEFKAKLAENGKDYANEYFSEDKHFKQLSHYLQPLD